jgi:carboxyl-terminal processing protease
MENSKRGILFFTVIILVSAIAGGLYGPQMKATAADADTDQQSVREFTQALSIIQHNYAEPVDTEKVIYDGAIPGMLHVLDPHSNFFDPKQTAALKEEQEARYYGVGMSIAPRAGHTYVLVPFTGSPADKAGIRPGDEILKVDGNSAIGLSSDDVAKMLKGPKGTKVSIALGREGWDQPIQVTVTRAEIPRPSVDFYSMAKPGIGYIRVSSFLDENLDQEFARALHQLDYAHLDGLILDLRGNGGGLLNQAVGLADMFLDKHELVVSQRGRATPEQRYYAVNGNQGMRVPLIVLIDNHSASASEIVSGAIQDHDRGLIVGETSFGKGLVQSAFPISEDTALWLTTAKYYTPSGRLIQRDYKSVSLYDYIYNPKPPKNPEVKLTDSGREVRGGDGITPDVVYEPPKLDPFQETLVRHDVVYPFKDGVGDFTRFYLGQRPQITKDFTVDDAVVKQLKVFLDKEHITYTDADIQANLPWIQWRIQREIFTSVFGINEGNKIELREDPEVAKAEELFPQAKALYENARKVMAEKQSTDPSLQP